LVRVGDDRATSCRRLLVANPLRAVEHDGREKTGGRKKGTGNIVTNDMKEAIVASFNSLQSSAWAS
jgi:hypothetical protein